MPQMFDAVNLKEIAMDVKHAAQPILTKKQRDDSMRCFYEREQYGTRDINAGTTPRDDNKRRGVWPVL